MSTKLHRAFRLFPVRPPPQNVAAEGGRGRTGGRRIGTGTGKDFRWIENGLRKVGNSVENMGNGLFRAAVRSQSRISIFFWGGKGVSPNSRIAGFESPNRHRRVRRYASLLQGGGSWLRTSHRSRCLRIFLTIGPASRIEITLICWLQFGQQSGSTSYIF